jgi:hypothetical protein
MSLPIVGVEYVAVLDVVHTFLDIALPYGLLVGGDGDAKA